MDNPPHHSILFQKDSHAIGDGSGEALVDEGDGGPLHLLPDLPPDAVVDLVPDHPDDPLGVFLRRYHHIYLFSLRQTDLVAQVIVGSYFLIC